MRYLVVVNQSQSNYNSDLVHKTLTHIPGVLDWWHYLPNVYILDAPQNVDEKFIADSVIAQNPGLLFLVVAVELTRHNGVLPKAAWEWISKKTKVLFKVKPSPAPPEDLFKTIMQGYTNPLPPITPIPKTLSDILRMKR